ncbi:4-alpha-glucanotransferase [Haloarcula salina]|uniref:4-alpha-glucanotransferase n=1 Tax=Haloarcula salina TaxID=1429914 RepID=A0AA41G3A3_9EURY|nr:4-alpha-glucanotransferase [Haloarcula salina]MBV0903545.1 4-alpha-glucanotransferase [Haloarcula salina]
MRFQRQSGVFLHHTSLPSPHGIGDLGSGARAFVDFLDRADQSLWQFCPLGPTSSVHGNSPYQSASAFAGNPLLVDLRDLVERGYLDDGEVEPPDGVSDQQVRYDRVTAFKTERLRTAFERFEERASDDDRAAFERFRERESAWLEDYALFTALKGALDDGAWVDWPAGIKTRDPDAMARYREELADEVRYHAFVQWCFDEQWRDIAAYADERGIGLVGDLPIYVGFDSADVWANPEAFRLGDDRRPTEVAGVPPNMGDDGQRWGNPVYDWDALRADDYGWWLDRFERLFDLIDIARIDHFKGFDEFWSIPADAEDPAAGQWRDGPGAQFFETVEAELGDLPFLVEDLGFLDEGIVALRDEFGFPGMRVPQYADWCEEGHMYQPMHYPEQSVGYTSTHDTDTVVGYYRDLSDRQRDCLHYNLGTDGSEINWDLIEAVWNSNAGVAMTTMQDLLGLGSDARFNVPGTATGNWQWRVTEDGLGSDVAERLRQVTDRTIR